MVLRTMIEYLENAARRDRTTGVGVLACSDRCLVSDFNFDVSGTLEDVLFLLRTPRVALCVIGGGMIAVD